jgi:hypothetical protein
MIPLDKYEGKVIKEEEERGRRAVSTAEGN